MTDTIAVAAEEVKLKPKAAVIDDAFDDVIEDEILFPAFKKFHQSNEDEFTKSLTVAGLDVPDIGDLEEDPEKYLIFIKALWAQRENEKLAGIIGVIFKDKIENLAELNLLCANLREQDIDIETFPSSIPAPQTFKEKNFLYIFIDYNLGLVVGDQAKDNARKVAMSIYDEYPSGQKPMTILMSNEPNITSKKEEFKEKAGLLEGVFRVSPKGDLTNKSKVTLLARAYKEASKSNDALQNYITSLISASEEAQKNFITEVRELSIDDYEFIQETRLKKQKQPLGDYLGWLYGALWSNLLVTNKHLKPTQEQLDQITSHKAPLYDSLPSKKLAEIFTIALFETHLEDVKGHTWGSQEKNSKTFKHLHLGDIFTKSNSSTIYMVINPQCDLERPFDTNPNEDSSKPIDEKKLQSIYLIPGILEPFEKQSSPNPDRTEIFTFEEKRYKIDWKLKQIETVSLQNFEDWTKKNDLTRNYRLRLNYALEIQQKFTSHMSRVGLPVSPPLTHTIKLTLCYKSWETKSEYVKIWESSDNSFMSLTYDHKHKIRPTLKFGLDLKETLNDVTRELQKQEGERTGKVPSELTKRIKQVGDFEARFDKWFFDIDDFMLPKEGESAALENGLIAISYDAEKVADKFNTCPFWIKIEMKEKAAIGSVEEAKPVAEGEVVKTVEKKIE